MVTVAQSDCISVSLHNIVNGACEYMLLHVHLFSQLMNKLHEAYKKHTHKKNTLRYALHLLIFK